MTADIPGTLLLDPDVLDDPYPFYARLHREAPVWQVPGTEIFVASTFETVADATARVADFSSNMRCLLYRDDEGLPARLDFGDGGGFTLATADPPIHTVHRNVVFPELMAKRMASLEPEIASVANDCMDRAIDEANTDFMATVGNIVPITMISQLIGFQGSDLAQLLQTAFDSTMMVGASATLDELEALMVRSMETGAWITEQLAAVADDPHDDLLGTVARGLASGALEQVEGVTTLHDPAQRRRGVHDEPPRQRRPDPRRTPSAAGIDPRQTRSWSRRSSRRSCGSSRRSATSPDRCPPTRRSATSTSPPTRR